MRITKLNKNRLLFSQCLEQQRNILGVDMSLGDVKKLSERDVEKYFNRYQSVMGKKINGGLIDSSLQLVSKAYFLFSSG